MEFLSVLQIETIIFDKMYDSQKNDYVGNNTSFRELLTR